MERFKTVKTLGELRELTQGLPDSTPVLIDTDRRMYSECAGEVYFSAQDDCDVVQLNVGRD